MFAGAYGTVWEGLWGNQKVAIKVLKPDMGVVDDAADDDDMTEKFSQECGLLSVLVFARLNCRPIKPYTDVTCNHTLCVFRRCETLQAVKHPNLLVFLGTGTTSDSSRYMVNYLAPAGVFVFETRPPITTILFVS
jgi:hypothetical protein